MRKIKVAAIQPRYIGVPEKYNYLVNDCYKSPNEISEEYVSRHSQITFDLLEMAGKQGCDIVVTSENLTGTVFFSNDASDKNIYPELLRVSCPIVEARLSELARKYSMYIVACYNKFIDNNCYNAAVIFDRSGHICGTYKKTHLPADEKWQNTEGDSIDVFDLDFGKIGICTCYDMMFPEFVEVQSLMGAEIIFHPTAGYGWYDSIGEATLRTRANDNSVYIVTAKNYLFNSAGKSSVIDFWGQVLADAGFYENVIVCSEIDLDFKKTQPEWYNPTVMSGTADVHARKLLERRPELYGKISAILHEKLQIPDDSRKKEIIEAIKNGSCRW